MRTPQEIDNFFDFMVKFLNKLKLQSESEYVRGTVITQFTNTRKTTPSIKITRNLLKIGDPTVIGVDFHVYIKNVITKNTKKNELVSNIPLVDRFRLVVNDIIYKFLYPNIELYKGYTVQFTLNSIPVRVRFESTTQISNIIAENINKQIIKTTFSIY